MRLYEDRGIDIETAETPEGTAQLWRLADAIYVTRVAGKMDLEHAALFVSYGERMVQRSGGNIRVFHDWIDMTGYTSESRKQLTDWSIAHLDAYVQVHIALRSKLVAMGVQVANIALGGLIQMHRSRASLEVALDRALKDAAV